MTHLSPSTARALKAAGFPQPTQTPAAGQVWYNAINSSPYYITASEGERCDYVAGEVFYIDRYLNKGDVFAPNAEDILRELSKIAYPNVIRIDASSYNSSAPGVIMDAEYSVQSFPKKMFPETGFCPSLIEALANAYLKIHAPK